MVIFKIHAAGNKSCVQVVLLHVPCLKTIALEPCLQELNEIQRFKARVMNEAPPHPHHRRASWRYRQCARAQVLGGERERERERVENSDWIEDGSRRGHVSTRTRLPLLPLRLKSAVGFFPFSLLLITLTLLFHGLYVFVCVLLIF